MPSGTRMQCRVIAGNLWSFCVGFSVEIANKLKKFKLTHYQSEDSLDFRFLFAIMPSVEETGNGGRLHCLPRLSRATRR
jgi:hypothetical protein